MGIPRFQTLLTHRKVTGAAEILASDKCRAMIHERGQEDWESEYGRMPRLFEEPESIPGLTWPTITFRDKLTHGAVTL